MDDAQNTYPKPYTYELEPGEFYTVAPEIAFYTEVFDFMGDKKLNLALMLVDCETGDYFADVTVNLGEFIGIKNAAYLDVNNSPGIVKWLTDNNIGRVTALTKSSGYCTYPLAVFDEGLLRSIGGEGLEAYHAQFEARENDRKEPSARKADSSTRKKQRGGRER